MGLLLYSIIALIVLTLVRKYIKGPKAKRTNMKNKVVVITGSSDGIGKEQAFQLLEDGAIVIFACRSESKTKKAFEEIKSLKNSEDCLKRAHFIQLDLKSFKSVNYFINQFKSKFNKIDILVNNAGIAASSFEITEDGLESMIQTNHYSHVKLTLGLLDLFDKTEGRIINVSSLAHNFSNYDTTIKKNFGKDKDQYKDYFFIPKNNIPYGNSKIANIYFTQYLVELFESNEKYANLYSYSLHPGAVDTNFLNNYVSKSLFWRILVNVFYPFVYFFFKASNDGAQTQLHLCYSAVKDLKQGGYYSDCQLGKLSETTKNKEIKDYLMNETLKIVS